MFILDGKRLQPGTPFRHAGIQYPANWLQKASPAERAAIGITEVPDPVRPDDRLYYVTENADGTFSTTPRPVEQLRAAKLAAIEAHAAGLRQAVVGQTSPAEMASWAIKRTEALALSSGGDAPMLKAEAEARGVPLAALADKVLEKAALFASAEAAISGAAGRHADAVKRLDTAEAIVDYDYLAGWPGLS